MHWRQRKETLVWFIGRLWNYSFILSVYLTHDDETILRIEKREQRLDWATERDRTAQLGHPPRPGEPNWTARPVAGRWKNGIKKKKMAHLLVDNETSLLIDRLFCARHTAPSLEYWAGAQGIGCTFLLQLEFIGLDCYRFYASFCPSVFLDGYSKIKASYLLVLDNCGKKTP